MDIICDVGGVYDPTTNRFDHHQKSFETTWEEKSSKNIKLSSAGLIYKHYGREIIRNIALNEYNKELSDNHLHIIYEKIYSQLIMEIDAIDNGVDQGKDLLYRIDTSLSGRISSFNKPWNSPEKFSSDPLAFSNGQDRQFKKAMKLCEQTFIHKLYSIINIILPAR